MTVQAAKALACTGGALQEALDSAREQAQRGLAETRRSLHLRGYAGSFLHPHAFRKDSREESIHA